MDAYRYLGRYWGELLIAGSLTFLAMILTEPLWQ